MEPTEGTGIFDAIDCEEPYPGILRQSFSTERATVSRYTFSPRASFPLHRHPQEQITLVEQGSVEMTIEGKPTTMGAGAFSVVPGNVEHGITAGDSGARIVAVVMPQRAVHPDAPQVRVLDGTSGAELPIAASRGTARAILWPGTGTELRSLHRIDLAPGGETVELTHPADAVYYVVTGGGEVEDASDRSSERLVEGSMVHVDAGTTYVLRAAEAGMEVVGGPAPADPALYESVGGS